MPAKAPMYLKTTTPKRGKKMRLRDVLSGDMISPPLGDVRHSAHVGPDGEGDMFGDVGFLRGKMDMLPSLSRLQNGHVHTERRPDDEGFPGNHDSDDYSYNGYHYRHPSTGLLKTTVSMPVFIAHEQAPPKPPRLHLDDPAPPSLPSQAPPSHLRHHHHHHQQPPPPSQSNGHNHPGNGQQQHQHRTPALCENGVGEPCRDISFSLVPSSGSFSEVSSEDSASETCGPPDARRGLSLDSDAGLSNEDLRSERSESPCSPARPAGHPGVSRSDSMAGLDLDLGPSIMEDVLSIMDRYKAVDDRCEL